MEPSRVRKAYKRACLVIHPDKVWGRGARVGEGVWQTCTHTDAHRRTHRRTHTHSHILDALVFDSTKAQTRHTESWQRRFSFSSHRRLRPLKRNREPPLSTQSYPALFCFPPPSRSALFDGCVRVSAVCLSTWVPRCQH